MWRWPEEDGDTQEPTISIAVQEGLGTPARGSCCRHNVPSTYGMSAPLLAHPATYVAALLRARTGDVSSVWSEVSSTMTSMSSSLERRARGQVFDPAPWELCGKSVPQAPAPSLSYTRPPWVGRDKNSQGFFRETGMATLWMTLKSLTYWHQIQNSLLKIPMLKRTLKWSFDPLRYEHRSHLESKETI